MKTMMMRACQKERSPFVKKLQNVRKLPLLGLCLASTLAAGWSAAQESVDTIETWSEGGTAGWTKGSSQTELGNPGGELVLTHRRQGRPAYAADTVRAPIVPGVRVTNVMFRFESPDTRASNLKVVLHAARSGRRWYRSLAVPAAGEERMFSLDVSYTGGHWKIGPNSSEGEFDEDIGLIDWVGVEVVRGADTASQAFVLDDFRLQGVYYSDLDGDRIPNAWEMMYGLDPEQAADAAGDLDRDGMSNFAEYWAGTAPDDEDSVFLVEIGGTNGPPGAASVVLRWRSLEGRTYAVLGAPAVGAAFGRLDTGIEATPSTNVYPAAGGDTPMRFYRVEVEVPSP